MKRVGVDPFLEACGASGRLVLGIERVLDAAASLPQTTAIGQPCVLVGRSSAADVHLDDPQVSRRHTYFQLIGGRLFGIDLGSRTGTLLNGRRHQVGWVPAGAGVGIGPFELRFLHASGSYRDHDYAPNLGERIDAGESYDPLTATFSADGTELPPARLEVAIPGARTRIWRMRGALALVGQSPICRLRMLDHRLEQIHCALVRTADGLWAVDLLTEWGTEQNGIPVRSCRLDLGDRLDIGPLRIRLLESNANVPARAAREPVVSTAAVLETGFHRTGRLRDSERGEWLPAVANGSGLPAFSREAANRLDALERRQEAMQDQFQQALVMMLQAFGGMHREQMEVLASEVAEVRRLSEAIDGLRAELNRRPAESIPERVTEKRVDAGADPAKSRRLVSDPEPVTPPAFSEADPDAPRVRRDPREIHAFVSERLAMFERERQNRWNRILRTLTGTS